MAPLSAENLNAVIMYITSRDLGGKDGSAVASFSASQTLILQSLALSSAIISVISSLVAFYWFLKMRRSFRHDLIMLLIQSDMFKALWYMVFPIASFIRGPIQSSSGFCQVTGFLLAVGIEAADVAILLIALHTALYVFGPRANSRDRGLYPYRRFAYTAWAIFPLLAASLAFVNKDGYIAQGTYCYLPVRPFWYRLALSWVPRYSIFITILGLYASIYFYVNKKLHGFRKEAVGDHGRQHIAVHRNQLSPPQHQSSVPPMPALNAHGLLPDSRPASVQMAENNPTVSEMLSHYTPKSPTNWTFPNWTSKSDAEPASKTSTSETDSFAGPSTPRPMPSYVDPASRSSIPEGDSVVPTLSRLSSWRDDFVHRFSPNRTNTGKATEVDILTTLRHRPDMSESSSAPIPRLRLVNTMGQDLQDIDLIQTRNKFRRQLRFLFLYPLVYMAMWVVPFIYHALMYNDELAIHPPFAMRAISIVITCLQAAIDCGLFLIREQPWKHTTGWGELRKRGTFTSPGPGKTREEMHREARAAYIRRNEEIHERRNTVLSSKTEDHDDNRKRERSWWDTGGLYLLPSPIDRRESNEPWLSSSIVMKDYSSSVASAVKTLSVDHREDHITPRRGGNYEEDMYILILRIGQS